MQYKIDKNNFDKLVDKGIFDKLYKKNKSIDLINNFVRTTWNSSCFFGCSKIVFDDINNILSITFKHSKFIGVPRGYVYNFQDFVTRLNLKLHALGYEVINKDIITKHFGQKRDIMHIKLY